MPTSRKKAQASDLTEPYGQKRRRSYATIIRWLSGIVAWDSNRIAEQKAAHWLLLLAWAGLVAALFLRSVREIGGVVTVLIAVLLTGTLRSAFFKPRFLIMMMVRFPRACENQPINQGWEARLAGISDKFRTPGSGFLMPQLPRGFWPNRT